MKIFTKEAGNARLYTLPEGMPWEMRYEYVPGAYLCIVLHIDENSFPLCSSWELMDADNDLGSYDVAEYYSAVVREVYRVIGEEGHSCVDMDVIRKELLPKYWAKWREAGIVTGDVPDLDVM